MQTKHFLWNLCPKAVIIVPESNSILSLQRRHFQTFSSNPVLFSCQTRSKAALKSSLVNGSHNWPNLRGNFGISGFDSAFLLFLSRCRSKSDSARISSNSVLDFLWETRLTVQLYQTLGAEMGTGGMVGGIPIVNFELTPSS